MSVTTEEMKQEAVSRLQLMNVPEEHIQIFKAGKIPITYFNGKVGCELQDIHRQALAELERIDKHALPFYITESWHGVGIVSVLYVDEEKENWKAEEEEAKAEGYHSIFAYCADQKELSEIGSGIFSIEDQVLWRIG